MLVAAIPASGLGNQLFGYVATKCISIDLDREYHYLVGESELQQMSFGLDVCGHRYSEKFERAFSIDPTERLLSIPSVISNEWQWKSETETNYNHDVYDVSDNTLLKGYFLSPAYFSKHQAAVRRWLSFNPVIHAEATRLLSEHMAASGCEYCIAVHVRSGPDFQHLGWVLERDYYDTALERIWTEFPKDRCLLVLISDQPETARCLLPEDRVFVSRNDMYLDLCLMSLCHGHIIANSTFSWWGAWLAGSSSRTVVRPSVWPLWPGSENGGTPDDVWPRRWVAVHAVTAPKVLPPTSRTRTRRARAAGKLSRILARYAGDA